MKKGCGFFGNSILRVLYREAAGQERISTGGDPLRKECAPCRVKAQSVDQAGEYFFKGRMK